LKKNAKSDHPPRRETRRQTSWETSWGDKKEDQLRDKLGDKGDKTSGRRTHHPTQGNKKGDNGRLRGRQNRGKADAPSNTERYRHTCGETMGDKRRQDLGMWDTPSNTGTHVGRQWETMKRNRRQRETGRQEGRQWEAIGRTMGGNGRQVETRPWGSGQTISHRLTCEETVGDKRQDVEEADTPSNKGKQEGRWETRGNKTPGRRTHHPTQADTRRQDRGKADTPSKAEAPSITGTHVGDKGRQDLEKADTPSNTGRQDKTPPNTGTHVGRQKGRQDVEKAAQVWADNGRQWAQWERRGEKSWGRRTHHPKEAPWGTRGDQGDKTLKRRAHHPRKGNKKGGGRQWKIQGETRPWEGGHTIQHKRILWGDTGRQRETRGDKTSGRRKCHQADIPSQAHTWGVKTS